MGAPRGLGCGLSWGCALLGLFVCLGIAPAEEGRCRLELKKLSGGSRMFSGGGEDSVYRHTYPQHTFARLDEAGVDPSFARLVKKQPAYNAQRPLRGVLRLAGQQRGN